MTDQRVIARVRHSSQLRISIAQEGLVTELPGVSGFTNVDAVQDPNYFVEFLDARTSIEGERAVKELVLSMLALENGHSVLDVGCGTGDDTREIARLVAPHGRVVGIDFSAAMIAESRRRTG